MAEDAWNTRDPARVALAYTTDSRWRNSEFLQGRAAIEAFLTHKWTRELDYRLIKEVWAFRDNRIAVRFAYEWHDDSGNWFRSYGNENWEFDEHGLMRLRIARHQRPPDQRERAQISLAARPAPRQSPLAERARAVADEALIWSEVLPASSMEWGLQDRTSESASRNPTPCFSWGNVEPGDDKAQAPCRTRIVWRSWRRRP